MFWNAEHVNKCILQPCLARVKVEARQAIKSCATATAECNGLKSWRLAKALYAAHIRCMSGSGKWLLMTRPKSESTSLNNGVSKQRSLEHLSQVQPPSPEGMSNRSIQLPGPRPNFEATSSKKKDKRSQDLQIASGQIEAERDLATVWYFPKSWSSRPFYKEYNYSHVAGGNDTQASFLCAVDEVIRRANLRQTGLQIGPRVSWRQPTSSHASCNEQNF